MANIKTNALGTSEILWSGSVSFAGMKVFVILLYGPVHWPRYDEEFSMWGAENVEMGFRTWLCGGRLECAPCAMTYHIYRNG